MHFDSGELASRMIKVGSKGDLRKLNSANLHYKMINIKMVQKHDLVPLIANRTVQ